MFLIFFFFFSLLSLIYGVLTIEIRRAMNESSSTQRELRVSTKNTGFRREFKLKVQKILIFGIFSDLRCFDGQN